MKAEFPIVSFISLILVLLTLPWHWRTRNINTLAAVVWLALCNIIRGVNSIVWAGNVAVRLKVWCDITTKIIIGANIGVPASILCVNRYLAQVASPCRVVPVAGDVRRRKIFELEMCVGLPIVLMVLHYVVQSHRFDIVEDFGCNGAVHVSIPGLFIMMIPPLVVSLIALVYGGIALRWFIHRRVQFPQVLHPSRSGLTTDRYLRLVALSITEMTFATVMTLFSLVFNLQGGLQPWTSWESVHTNWTRIEQFPRDELPERFWTVFTAIWYILPITSVLFFGVFGLGQETLAEYKTLFVWIKVHVFQIRRKHAPALPVIHDAISTFDPAMSAANARLRPGTTNTLAAGSKIDDTESGAEELGDLRISTCANSRPSVAPVT